MFKVAEKNVGKPVSDTKFSDDNAVDAVNFKDESWRKSSSRVNGVNVNTQAKAVKWKKEEKPVQKYFYNDKQESQSGKQSQSLRDRKYLKQQDKMLSDEESKIYFYTTSSYNNNNNNNNNININNNNLRQFNFRSDSDQEESILEKFSSGSSSNFVSLSVSYYLLVVLTISRTLRTFI